MLIRISGSPEVGGVTILPGEYEAKIEPNGDESEIVKIVLVRGSESVRASREEWEEAGAEFVLGM